jgi:hypothetical protein
VSQTEPVNPIGPVAIDHHGGATGGCVGGPEDGVESTWERFASQVELPIGTHWAVADDQPAGSRIAVGGEPFSHHRHHRATRPQAWLVEPLCSDWPSTLGKRSFTKPTTALSVLVVLATHA